MGANLNPYLTFNGNARAALEFYREVFGGALTVNTFGDFGSDDPAVVDSVMHGQLVTDLGFILMASDTGPGMGQVTAGSTMSISVSGDDPAIRDYWAKLADAGTVHMPMAKQVWGDEFGMLEDRYGVSWLIDISGPASDG